jgi:predicted metal-dependent hydrolase
MLGKRYPDGMHSVQTDRALYDYVSDLKSEFMRKAEPLSKVMFDNKLHVIRNALGTHTTVSRVQGGKLKAKREIRVASLFKGVPLAWLRMIVVHELAHTKEKSHDKAFYALCAHMEPDYHQLEFDLRLYLTHLDTGGEPLWSTASKAP